MGGSRAHGAESAVRHACANTLQPEQQSETLHQKKKKVKNGSCNSRIAALKEGYFSFFFFILKTGEN